MRRQGFSISASEDRLRVRPARALTPALVADLALHKADLMRLLSPARQFVTLNGGATVPAPALRLALALESRGVRLSLESGQLAIDALSDEISEADRIDFHRWKSHLASLIAYHCPGEEWPQ
jgi:hypothetical protein